MQVLLEGIKYWINKFFLRKDEVSEYVAQSDWAENDENSPSYIKNRIGYEVFNEGMLFDNVVNTYWNGAMGGYWYTFDSDFELGSDEYTVIIGDEEYTMCRQETEDYVYYVRNDFNPDTGENSSPRMILRNDSWMIQVGWYWVENLHLIVKDGRDVIKISNKFIDYDSSMQIQNVKNRADEILNVANSALDTANNALDTANNISDGIIQKYTSDSSYFDKFLRYNKMGYLYGSDIDIDFSSVDFNSYSKVTDQIFDNIRNDRPFVLKNELVQQDNYNVNCKYYDKDFKVTDMRPNYPILCIKTNDDAIDHVSGNHRYICVDICGTLWQVEVEVSPNSHNYGKITFTFTNYKIISPTSNLYDYRQIIKKNNDDLLKGVAITPNKQWSPHEKDIIDRDGWNITDFIDIRNYRNLLLRGDGIINLIGYDDNYNYKNEIYTYSSIIDNSNGGRLLDKLGCSYIRVEWFGERDFNIFAIEEYYKDLVTKDNVDEYIPTVLPNPQALTINGKTYDGSEAVNVSITTDSAVEYDDTEIRGLIDNKVAKESGKGLSTNDLTNELKGKIESALQTIPSEYITETELTNKGYATTSYVDGKLTIETVTDAEYAAIFGGDI